MFKRAAVPTQPPSEREALRCFWSTPVPALLTTLGSTLEGLGGEAAAARLARSGPNRLGEPPRSDAAALLLRQFSGPIILILIGAAALSFLLGESTDGTIILAIVFVSGLLGFWQERGAA